ncbi:hypothetical protein AHAS_Ahas13G0293400 [Arachis hypogaea]
MEAMANLANTIEANAAATLQVVQRLGQLEENGNGNENGSEHAEGNSNDLGDALMNLAIFLKFHPSTFRGSNNPTEADNWFQGEAQHWWQRERQLMQLPNAEIPWDAFQTAFYKKYFPKSARKAKKMELMQLKQGSLSVAEYTSQFEELCRFSRACQGAPETYESWK